MTLGSRINERLEALGLTQSALARRIGVAQGTIAHLISGRSQNSVHLPAIARELQCSVAYLQCLTDDLSPDAAPALTREEMASELELVALKEIDLSFGMGGNFLDVQAVAETIRYFPRSWLRMFTVTDPAHLVFTRGDGDSMEPTIRHNDIVLIDRSQTSINKQDRIWAVAWGEIGMIKRIRAMPDGSYKIMSDNPSVDPETGVDGELHVIGRVVAAIRGL